MKFCLHLVLMFYLLIEKCMGNTPIALGFPSDYYCTGRIFDEPRKYRTKCVKNPPRKLNCSCDQEGNSRQMNCKCDHSVASRLGPIRPGYPVNEEVMLENTPYDISNPLFTHE